MGRKGVSMRKPSPKKAKRLAGDNASPAASSAGRVTSSQPVKLPDMDKAGIPPSRVGVKPSSDLRKNPKKC